MRTSCRRSPTTASPSRPSNEPRRNAWTDHMSTPSPRPIDPTSAPLPAPLPPRTRDPRLRRVLWALGALVLLVVVYRWWTAAESDVAEYLTAPVDRGPI